MLLIEYFNVVMGVLKHIYINVNSVNYIDESESSNTVDNSFRSSGFKIKKYLRGRINCVMPIVYHIPENKKEKLRRKI